MKGDSRERIEKATEDLPERWRFVLEQALLDGEFPSGAEKLLASAIAVHSRRSPGMETAESILAGDAFIPMAVEDMLDNGVTLTEMERILSETARRLVPDGPTCHDAT